MSEQQEKPGMFDARRDTPKVAWMIFYRPKPKRIPQLVHVAGNVAEALICAKEAARQLKVPDKKIETVMYVPASLSERRRAKRESGGPR